MFETSSSLRGVKSLSNLQVMFFAFVLIFPRDELRSVDIFYWIPNFKQVTVFPMRIKSINVIYQDCFLNIYELNYLLHDFRSEKKYFVTFRKI